MRVYSYACVMYTIKSDKEIENILYITRIIINYLRNVSYDNLPLQVRVNYIIYIFFIITPYMTTEFHSKLRGLK